MIIEKTKMGKRINVGVFKKQKEAMKLLLDKKTKKIGYGGAAGGGKSWIGCLWLVSMCISYKGVRYALCRRKLKTLKNTTLITLFKVMNSAGIHANYYKYNQELDTITFVNGSQIMLLDMDYKPSDPEYTRFGGIELTGAFVDEANECQHKAIETIYSRVGRCMNKEYGIIGKVFHVFNPQKNWVYFEYYKPYRDGTLEDHVAFVRALATDNPFINNEYIESLKKLPKEMRERLLYGNFDYEDDPTQMIPYDAIVDLWTNKGVSKEGKYITVDVARKGEDKAVAMTWHGLEVVRVKKWDKCTLTEIEQYIEQERERENIRRGNVVVDEDGVGGGIVDHLEGVNGFVNNARPINNKRGEKTANFQNLKTQCYFKLADMIKSGAIAVKPEEIKSELIEELEQIRIKYPDKDSVLMIQTKEEIKERIGRSPDYADTMMMRMYFEIQQKYYYGEAIQDTI